MTDTVYAHVVAGSLWAAAQDRPTRPVNCPVVEFIASLGPEVRRLRMLGTASNAPLLTAAYRDGQRYVEVASPAACEAPAELEHPEIVVHRMRQCLRSPSLGGFHRLTGADYGAYGLAERLAEDRGVSPAVLSLLDSHPAWHDLRFIRTVARASVAVLLSLILDPRWFVDPYHPERVARLFAYLGLTPRVQKCVSGTGGDGAGAARCRIVLQCWNQSAPLTDGERAHPGNFLWRRRHAAGGGARGDLRASQAFVAYLAKTWLQQIVRVAATCPMDPLFVPEMLLRGAELPAYRELAASRPPL